MTTLSDILRGTANQLGGPLEPIATMGSGMASMAAGGLTGLLRAIGARTPEEARQKIMRSAQGAQEAGTYMPRTEAGQQSMADLLRGMQGAGEAITDVAPILSGEYRGDKVLELTGSPGLATLADVISPMDVPLPGAKLVPAMFLGAQAMRRAKAAGDTVPQEMFDIANALEARGKTPDEIWEATGMHAQRKGAPYAGVERGVDEKLRFEIPDKDVTINEAATDPATLETFLEHPELYRLLPGLKESPVRFDFNPDTRVGGSYNPRTATISVNPARGSEGSRKSTLHETMHAVQDEERFFQGGSQRMFSDIEEPSVRYAKYRALPGEIEARLVEERSKLPLEELRRRPPRMKAKHAGFQQWVTDLIRGQ